MLYSRRNCFNANEIGKVNFYFSIHYCLLNYGLLNSKTLREYYETFHKISALLLYLTTRLTNSICAKLL